MLWQVHPRSGKQLPTSIALYRKATALRPDVANNWYMLASFLIEAKQNEEAVAVLRQAISKLPTDPKLYLILAQIHHTTRRATLAREVLERAPAVPEDDRDMIISRLTLLIDIGVADKAQAATDILALDPVNSYALMLLGAVTRRTGSSQKMIPFCRAALDAEPGHTRARYELAVALARLGRSQEARQMIDLNQFVRVIDLRPPESYVNAETLENALVSEITRNSTLEADPVDRATRGGFQTSASLPQPGDDAIGIVLDRIRVQVDRFETSLPEDLSDPFVAKRPRHVELRAWAVVYPRGGWQKPHIHDTGWLSGVYYVSAPKASGHDPRGGLLVLGKFENGQPGTDPPPWGVRDIRPLPGRLVLFPSYIPHSTIPTNSSDQRICLAFDVMRSPA
jgi:Flp pilus assembly protein TadD